jgi:HD-like signal output (HDOD) protein
MNSLNERETLCSVERAELGFDHTQLAEAVAKTWGFPAGVTAAARYHHAPISCRGDAIETVRCVEVANIVCSLKGTTSVGMHLVRFPNPTIAALGLTKDDIVVLAEDLDQELVSNQSLFQI